METGAPKISVCIPVYNCREYIAQAVESALAQTFTDFELIIVDNASTDGTGEVIASFKDKRVRTFRNPAKLPPQESWNKTISCARGRYIKLLPADDTISPDCLKKQSDALDGAENSGVVMVCCGRNIINEKSEPVFRRGFPGEGRIAGRAAIKKIVACGTNPIGEPGAVLIRKSALDKAGGFDGTLPYCIDVDLWARLLLLGDIFALPDYLASFRVSRSAWSTAIRREQSRQYRAFIDKLRADSRYNITRAESLIGKLKVFANALLRRIFYLIYLG